MGLKDTITGLFHRKEELTTADETAQLERKQGQQVNPRNRLSVRNDRYSVIADCREMYEDDPRAKNIIQTLARDAAKSGFQVEVADSRAADVAAAVIKRLKLDERLDDWTRLALRDGDCLIELGINRAREIAVATRKPTLQIHRNSNDRDVFDDPTMAFWMSKKAWVVKPPRDAIWFAEWQIVHARWDHDEGRRYGRPLLSASRKAWKRMDEGELDVAVRRKTRAGLKYAHILKGADEAALLRYQEINKAALDAPFAAVADFFMNSDGDIKTIEGDARLSELADILHHIHTFWQSSPVPMSVIGYGTDIDFSVIGHQKEQYDETLPEVRKWVSGAFIAPILERQWLLAGILPETLKYKIKWPSKKEPTAMDLDSISRAVLQLRTVGVSEEILALILARFLPGIEPEMLFPDMDGASADSVERLANIAQSLTRGLRAKNAAQKVSEGR